MNPTFNPTFSSESPNYAPCSYLTGQWSYWNTLGDKWRVETRQWPPNAKSSCQDKNNTSESFTVDYYDEQEVQVQPNNVDYTYYGQQELQPEYEYSENAYNDQEVQPEYNDYYDQQELQPEYNDYYDQQEVQPEYNAYYDQQEQQEGYAPNYSYSQLSDSCGDSEVSPLNSPASTNTMLSFTAYGNSPYSAYVQSMNPSASQFSMSQLPAQLSVERFTSVNKNKKYANLGETWACGM